jgi:phage major head subunit gpT-like protein
METSKDNPKPPESLDLVAAMQIDVAAADAGGKAPLPRFTMVAYTGGPMKIGGWRYPVVVDLAGMAIPSQSRPVRFGHDATSGVGHTDRIAVEGGCLMAAGVVSRDTAAAREIVVSARNGFPWQASIGASVEQFEFVQEGQAVLVNGREFEGPVNVVRRATLGEISFVDLGADGQTSARLAAAAKEKGIMDATKTDKQGEIVAAGAPAPVVQAGADKAPARIEAQAAPVAKAGAAPVDAALIIDPVADMRARAAAEEERIAAVRKVCGGDHADIAAKALRDGWDVTRTELEVLRADRPKAPAAHIVDNTMTGAVLEAACMLTARLADAEKVHDEKTLDAASRRFRGGIGLQELLLEAAWANGYTGRNFRDSRGALRFAFGQHVQAGFSTIDVGGILSNVANKFLLEGFFSVERVWRSICAVRNVSDFKTVTSYRLVGKDQYEPVAPGGELKHGTLGEESYTNRADTFGLLLAIDRRDMINDDLGAVTTVPRKLGRGSGLKINDVFWTIFLANSAFFKTANKNYVEGADTALTIDGLTKVEKTFMEQVDADGKPIGVMPAILLAPTALSAMATQLLKSVEIRDTTASTKYPVANPHQGKFRTEVSRYLSNAKYPGNSEKAWYLLADPRDLPVIEVAFLNGQESPTIETAEADFNVLGIQMRGYHDFGCALQDPRGGVRAKGEA